MATNWKRSLLLTGALAALAGVTSVSAAAADTSRASYDASAPIVLAQATTPGSGERVVVPGEAYPAYQRGVREAASQGPEALRRYIWRTRMIYDYYYPDFVLD